MIRIGWNLAQLICLAQGRTVLKLGRIGSDLDIAPMYIFVRFKVNGAPKSLYIFRFARNLVQPTELGLEWCVPSFVKIGSDLDIAPIYIFVRFKVNGVPKSLYTFRLARKLTQRNELGQEWCVLSFLKIGSDVDIAPIYILVRFNVNGAPKSLYIIRFAQNLV